MSSPWRRRVRRRPRLRQRDAIRPSSRGTSGRLRGRRRPPCRRRSCHAPGVCGGSIPHRHCRVGCGDRDPRVPTSARRSSTCAWAEVPPADPSRAPVPGRRCCPPSALRAAARRGSGVNRWSGCCICSSFPAKLIHAVWGQFSEKAAHQNRAHMHHTGFWQVLTHFQCNRLVTRGHGERVTAQ